jgi:hypothetical protein
MKWKYKFVSHFRCKFGNLYNRDFLSALFSFHFRKTGIPLFATYVDGHRHTDIVASVGQSSVIEIIIYADGLDRDMMGHTSGRNKVHLTYVQILNLSVGRQRSADDYHLLQVNTSVLHCSCK